MYTTYKNTGEQSLFFIKSHCGVNEDQVQGLLKCKAFECIGFNAHKSLPMNSSTPSSFISVRSRALMESGKIPYQSNKERNVVGVQTMKMDYKNLLVWSTLHYCHGDQFDWWQYDFIEENLWYSRIVRTRRRSSNIEASLTWLINFMPIFGFLEILQHKFIQLLIYLNLNASYLRKRMK